MSISASQIIMKIEAETEKARVAKDSSAVKKHIGNIQLLCELVLESPSEQNVERHKLIQKDPKEEVELRTKQEEKVMMGNQPSASVEKETESIFDF